MQETRLDTWVGKTPWRSKWQPTPVFLPEEFHGQRSLAGYSPWSWKQSDMTEQLTLFFLGGNFWWPCFLTKLAVNENYCLPVTGSYVCYSKQVARCEQRTGGRGQVARTHASCKQQGCQGRQEKEPPDWQETTPSGRQVSWKQTKKGGERLEFPVSECNLLLIKLSLQ